MKVDFRKIKVQASVEGDIEEMDLAKIVGNAIYCNTPDIGESEFAKELYSLGEIEIDQQRADIIRAYIPLPTTIPAAIQVAVLNELDKVIINSQNQ